MCENEDDCINGGWLHPECTSDLVKMSQEQIDKLDKWYCEDCVEQRNRDKLRNISSLARKPQSDQPVEKEMPAPSITVVPSQPIFEQQQQQAILQPASTVIVP